MGFKFFRVNLTAGSAEFPTTDSDSARRSRAETIMQKIGYGLINCGAGWELDTSKNADLTSFVDIPANNSNLLWPGLFFTNTISGCKLFVAYFASYNQYGIKNFSGTGNDIIRMNDNTNRYTSGLCMSIIPAGSNNNFGDPTTTTFLPADATRIIGTVNCYYNSNDYGSYAYKPQSGYVASWGLFVTPYVIAVAALRASGVAPNLDAPIYAVGRIIKDLAHDADAAINAEYGVFAFRELGALKYEGTGAVINHTSYTFGPTSKSFIGLDPKASRATIGAIATYSNVCGSIAKADGSWINGTDTTNYSVIVYPADSGQLSPYILNNTSGKSRWCSFAIASVSNDPDTYGVVTGDGFKGYLDTDLFRCGSGLYCQMFDDGNFICASDTYNLLLGWDPANTDTLAGA